MEELTVEQYIEKYPFFKRMAENTLFTTKEDFEQMYNSEKIEVNYDEIPIEFLNRVLNNDFYYEYVCRYLLGEIDNFSVKFIVRGDAVPGFNCKRSSIVNAINKVILSGRLSLSIEEQQKYNYLKKIISFESFENKHKGNNFVIDIDGQSYSIPIDQLFSFIKSSDEEFDNLCSNGEIKEINGIKKEYFIYAAVRFFRDNRCISNYVIPENIIKRFKDITSYQKIDIESINKHVTTADTKYQKIKIDGELENAILSGMPEEASNLEKAMYIYIKMCKLLTYDDEYYAVNQKGVATEKHKNEEHITSITLENNEVVCYEFNMIYAKLLDKLGIHFASNYGEKVLGQFFFDESDYGGMHANLEFRDDKFLVSADSVTSILQGDITNAKMNQPLVGLNCLNKNIKTKEEFKELLSKLYKLVVEQEKGLNSEEQVEHIQTFDELLEEYSHATNNVKDISLDERLSILIDKVNSTKMVGIDSLSYVLQLKRILFNNEQRKNNVAVTFVRNNKPFEEEKVAMTSAIFVLNASGFESAPEQSIYYYYNPNHEITPVTKEDLQNMFNIGILTYIESDDPKIPGIVEREEMIR